MDIDSQPGAGDAFSRRAASPAKYRALRRAGALLAGLFIVPGFAQAQFGVAWRYVPELVVISATKDDSRLGLVDEAVAFWNRTLEELGSGFRLGPVRRVVQPPPEEALQRLSKLVLSGPVRTGDIPGSLLELPGDLRIVLANSVFVSTAGPFDANLRRVVAIRSAASPPLSLPNVARNLIAHELGHAIGLGHNSDPAALMCGRPASCRPSLFQSDEPRMFPLLESEKRTLLALYPPNWKPGIRGNAESDERIAEEAQLIASSARVDLYTHGVVVDPELVELAERALVQMEGLLGRPLDGATLGPRVRIYVAAAINVSHVWRGYAHPSDPRAVVFLNPIVARRALSGANATYAHELAHLLAWRYRSHTLREGLADWLALQVHPGAGVGPNFAGYDPPPDVPSEVMQYLGTTRPPPSAVRDDIRFRRGYYYASYRFVRFLIERAGMAAFLELYDAENPEGEFVRLYGAGREALAEASAN